MGRDGKWKKRETGNKIYYWITGSERNRIKQYKKELKKKENKEKGKINEVENRNKRLTWINRRGEEE